MHYFKRNIGDYHKKAGRLSMLEHGAYTLLLDACYDREEFPTMEEALDWCWARSDDEEAAVRFVLSKFFTLENDRYVQNRVREEIEAYRAMAAKNKEIAEKREATKRTKRAKESTKRADNNTDGSPDQHESPPNHKPLTNNHKPIVEAAVSTEERSATSPKENLPPANPENIPDEAPSRNVQVAVLLRSHGADPSTHPNSKGISAIVDLNATDEHILTALEAVKTRRKEANDPQPVNAAYLVPIIADLQKPQAEKPDQKPRDEWYRTEVGIDRKARELGMFARAGESYNEFKDRMFQEIKRREREQQGATV